MSESKELIIVAGLPRSGTTWLEGILNSHPKVFLYHEIDDGHLKKKFFSSINYKINQETEERYKNNLLAGIQHLQRTSIFDPYKKRKADLIGFKTVGRFTHPTIFTWMRKTLNYPKTIFILRHPAGYVASQLRFPVSQNLSPKDIVARKRWYIESLNGNLTADISLEQFCALFWKLSNEQILKSNINTKNFHFVIYEDLCCSTESTTENIFKFLQLKMHSNVSKYLMNSTNPERNLFTKLSSRRFYSTTKNPINSANKWMKELSEEQQSEVYSAVNDTFLMKFWKK